MIFLYQQTAWFTLATAKNIIARCALYYTNTTKLICYTDTPIHTYNSEKYSSYTRGTLSHPYDKKKIRFTQTNDSRSDSAREEKWKWKWKRLPFSPPIMRVVSEYIVNSASGNAKLTGSIACVLHFQWIFSVREWKYSQCGGILQVTDGECIFKCHWWWWWVHVGGILR